MVSDAEWAAHARFELGRVAGELDRLRATARFLVSLAGDRGVSLAPADDFVIDGFEVRRHVQLLQRQLADVEPAVQEALASCNRVLDVVEVREDGALSWNAFTLARSVRGAIQRLERQEDLRRRQHVDAQLACVRRARLLTDEGDRAALREELLAVQRRRRAQELNLMRAVETLARGLRRRLEVLGRGAGGQARK